MTHKHPEQAGIPISLSLEESLPAEEQDPLFTDDKKRLLYISLLAVLIGGAISGIAKVLVLLINLITNLSFYHSLSAGASSPAYHGYGPWVILVPVIGGLIVGLMAFYGSKAIRGHGIPEAMEQILVNKSQIRPSITYLKPLSSAVSIGTGGPFGAEGPIIATGGALGSTIGQVLRISPQERKVLLAAGATAGMSAIFGSPVAAIFLAIELLLFEFSPRSIIPVALACITGAAGHHLLFEAGPVFPMPALETPSNGAMAVYSVIGLLIGVAAAGITRLVYFIEDAFEKLPIHWMWWPALGGIVVGIVGYFAPHTLGVGYDNITGLLSGKMALAIVINLCVMKFISWSVALGSGTSGGTLAPLLTIGGATGALLGTAALHFFPGCGVVLPLAALIGMSAMFAGASRALLTSILFALETTGQSGSLLPLLAACVASYIVSFLILRNTIMTEKIARRGVKTPHSYQPDLLEKLTVRTMVQSTGTALAGALSLEEARRRIDGKILSVSDYLLVLGNGGSIAGLLSRDELFNLQHDAGGQVSGLVKRKPVLVSENASLKKAVHLMAKEHVEAVLVVAPGSKTVRGVLSYRDVLNAYQHSLEEHQEVVAIPVRRKAK